MQLDIESNTHSLLNRTPSRVGIRGTMVKGALQVPFKPVSVEDGLNRCDRLIATESIL